MYAHWKRHKVYSEWNLKTLLELNNFINQSLSYILESHADAERERNGGGEVSRMRKLKWMSVQTATCDVCVFYAQNESAFKRIFLQSDNIRFQCMDCITINMEFKAISWERVCVPLCLYEVHACIGIGKQVAWLVLAEFHTPSDTLWFIGAICFYSLPVFFSLSSSSLSSSLFCLCRSITFSIFDFVQLSIACLWQMQLWYNKAHIQTNEHKWPYESKRFDFASVVIVVFLFALFRARAHIDSHCCFLDFMFVYVCFCIKTNQSWASMGSRNAPPNDP